MKKFLPALLIFFSLSSLAQFKTIHVGGTTMYKYPFSFNRLGVIGSTGEFIPVRIENITIVNEDTLYTNYRIYSFTGNEEMDCKVTCKGYAWTGKRIIMTKDDREIFINRDSDSVIFKKYASINDSWIFYKTNENHFLATVINKTIETFNIEEERVTDSVLTISLSLRKNADNSPLAHPFNGKEWKISKKYGFVKTYDFLSFPRDTNALILAGVEKFNVGVKNLTENEIYDFEVGDELHVKEFNIINAQVESKIRQTILSKEFRNDSIIYKIEVLENITSKPILGGEETFTVNVDTVVFKVTLFPVLRGLNQIPIMAQDGSYGTQFLRNSIMVKMNSAIGYINSGDDSCYNEVITFLPNLGENEEYWKGLGGPYYYKGLDQIIYKDQRELVYYKKGSKEWGTPYNLVLGVYANKLNVAISLSPNPTTDRIKVSSEGIQNTTYKVYNIEGREMLNGNFLSTEESIDVNNLKSGIYSLMILKEGGVIYTSRFVKN